MKKIILIIILLIPLLIIKIPPYKELNNIAIIEKIIIKKNNNQYDLCLIEKIPIKNNQGIKYKYKKYKSTNKNILNAYKEIQNKSKKYIYIKKSNYLISNIKNTKKIIKKLGINPNHIIYKTNLTDYIS